MKKDQLAYGNIDKTDGIPDASRDKIEPTSSLINEEVDPPNDESVEKLLRSCQEHRNIFRRRFEAVIKLTAEVVKQNEYNVNCILQLLEFTIELQQEEIKLFSKIDLVRTQSQLSDERHMDQAEELHKWKTQHEVQIKEVEKLLSRLLHQRKTEGEPNYKGRLVISNRLTFFHFNYLILHANCN